VNSYLVYRASSYLMLFVATMALSGETPEGQFAKFLGMVVAVAGAVAFYAVDRKQMLVLPRQLANLLAVCTLGVLYFEYRLDDTQRIPALAHWLVYLQLIKYFLPKTAEDDWFLFLLGLMQVLIGSVVNQSDQVGSWLFVWAMLAVWVLGQFFLQREALRFSGATALGAMPLQSARQEFHALSVDPYRGLFDFPYVAATVRVMVTTLALGGLIFLVLPRQAGATRTQSGAPLARHLTGFDEEVQLGQLGEILENDSVVMTVQLFDEHGEATRPDEEPLWRGVTMLHYDAGRWVRQTKGSQAIVSFTEDPRLKNGRLIRQKIKLEPIDSATLFGIRPILNTSSVSERVQPSLSNNDGTLFRSDLLSGEYDYEVVSDRDTEGYQLHEAPPSTEDNVFLSMPPGLSEKLNAIAEPIVASIDPDRPDAIIARARALERYLRESGKFTYTLQMEIFDSKLDPVEDFLVNRKSGHCEYFASALALLLRSVGIRSRIVNGFKGGDWNEFTKALNVRQKHAHSWVEAYAGISMNVNKYPIWITLDPTPVAERKKSIAQVGGLAGNFRPLTDSMRHIWIFYVIGYDGDRQDSLIYGPMRTIANEVKRQYMKMGARLRQWFARIFHFENVNSFISPRGFFVSFFVLLLLVGVGKVLARLTQHLLRSLRGAVADSASLSPSTLFYRRLAQMLSEVELKRLPSETQGEFARRAQVFISAGGPQSDSVATVPHEVVDAFYRIRFGHLPLEPEVLETINDRLDALELRLKSP
jgi:protein-glutamine gamma-glutamyltransferase